MPRCDKFKSSLILHSGGGGYNKHDFNTTYLNLICCRIRKRYLNSIFSAFVFLGVIDHHQQLQQLFRSEVKSLSSNVKVSQGKKNKQTKNESHWRKTAEWNQCANLKIDASCRIFKAAVKVDCLNNCHHICFALVFTKITWAFILSVDSAEQNKSLRTQHSLV